MWPLGFIKVPIIGTPVALTSLIDPNNLSSPNTTTGPGNGPILTQQEYTISFRGLSIFGYKPGNNNNGMISNVGNIYLLGAPAGGSGNRSDSGAIIAVIAPLANYWYPPEGAGLERISPYFLWLDADNNNDGGLVIGYGASNP